MKKLIIVMIILISPFLIAAQEYNYKIVRKIKIDIKNVNEIKFDGNNFYILSEEKKLFTLNKNGEIVNLRNVTNIKGISRGKKNNIYFLNNEKSIINEKDNSYLIKSMNKNKQKWDQKLLCSDGTNFYTCILQGYSSRIVKINAKTGEEEFFTYLQGIPTGLHYKDGYLWYLYNKCKPNRNGVLLRYIVSGKKIPIKEVIPVKDPKGLDIDNENNIYTYSSKTREIIKLKRKKQ